MEPANSREYGRANLSHIDGEDELLKGIHVGSQIWMSHGDTITVLPDNFKVIASTDDVRAAAYHVEGEQTWGRSVSSGSIPFDRRYEVAG